MEWLIGVLRDFEHEGPLAHVTTVLAVVTAVVGIGVWVRGRYKRGLREHEERIDKLQRENVTLRAERDAARGDVRRLDAANDGLRRQTFDGVMERAAAERRDGNEERAIALMRAFVDHDGVALGGICRDIAGWHLSMLGGADADEHLVAAKRHATLAHYLAPGDDRAAAMLAEVNAITGAQALHAGDIARTCRDWQEALDWAPAGDDPALVGTLIDRAIKARDDGHWCQMLALSQRAVVAARRTLGIEHPLTCTARYYFCYALNLVGDPRAAWAEIDALLPIQRTVSGERHPETLWARWLKAQILQSLGQYAAALDEVEALLPLRTAVSGERHPGTLATRHLRAQVLESLGRYEPALDEVEALLPLRTAVSGERHPDTLATRHLRAQILESLERYEPAFDEVEALLPLQTAVSGDRHPGTLATRYLRAQVLESLGRYEPALDEVEALLPVEAAVMGERHPGTLLTRQLHGTILRRLGRIEAALAEHGAAHDAFVAVLREAHPSTLLAARELGLTRAAAGDGAGGRRLLEATLAAQERVLGLDHPDTRRTASALDDLAARATTD